MEVAAWKVMVGLCVMVLVSLGVQAATEDMGNGFEHHGVATPVSNHRGIVATQDGEGRDVALAWLFDHTGGYALLLVDAETGKSEQFPMPFPSGGDCPYGSILSTDNKFYTHFNSHFTEFDPVKRTFTYVHSTVKQMTMGMTEDDNGVIWSASYPDSALCSFDPKTRTFRDYGSVNKENWAQYQRYVASDDAGWIYFGIGSTASQIIAFDPQTETVKAIFPDDKRYNASGYVYRSNDGKVYGHNGKPAEDGWVMLHKGEITPLAEHTVANKKPIITSHQGLFHQQFPSGKVLSRLDTVERIMEVTDPVTEKKTRLTFDYTSEGAHIMGMCASPEGTMAGGTAFPMRYFSYNPKTDEWINRKAYGQFNTVVMQGDRFFTGGYGGGFLLEYDPASEWVPTVKNQAGCNPLFYIDCTPTIHRPHDLLAHPDGKTLILAGTPGYGATGGGLLFWDRETMDHVLLTHEDLLLEQSTRSLAALPDGNIVGGGTTGAGTGGEKKAEEADLYLLDLESKKITWHKVLFPGVQSYTDLHCAKNGMVYGVADLKRFFVFDPVKKEVLYEEDLTGTHGNTISHQGPRVFVTTPDKRLFMLFKKGIAEVNLETHAITMRAESPVSIGPGGDYLDGRIYFGSGSHMYSWEVPEK